jgi:hypothetical protein
MDSRQRQEVQDMIDRAVLKALSNRRHNISATATGARVSANRMDAAHAGESRELDMAFPPGIKALPMVGDRLQIALRHDQKSTTPGVDVCTGVQYPNQSGTEQFQDVGDQVLKPLPAVAEGEIVLCAPGAPAEAKIYEDIKGNIWITAKIGEVKNRNYFPESPVSASDKGGCLFYEADVEFHITAPKAFINATEQAVVTSPKVVFITQDLELGADGLGADNGIVRKSDLAHALTTHKHADPQGGTTGVGTDTSTASASARCI